jgi:hypothetical protein
MATTDLIVEQGKTYSQSLRWNVSSDGGATKTPVSLAGKKARMQIRPRAGAPAWVTVVSDAADTYWDVHTNLVLEANGDTGRIDIVISAVVTDQIPENGAYELVVYSTTDQVSTVMRGKVNTVKKLVVL